MEERADKKKNIDKVVASLVKDPLQTEQQIARDTWISQSAVNRAKKEVGKNGLKDDRIMNLTDKDFDLMKSIQKEKTKRLKEETKEISNLDIDRWENTATKRYSLFRWKATDNEWWAKDIWLILKEIQGIED